MRTGRIGNVLVVIVLAGLSGAVLYGAEGTVQVGVARIDITPDVPVRMYGYASRKTESEGVAGRLFARALVIGIDEGQGPAVLLSVENGAVPEELAADVFAEAVLDAHRNAAQCVVVSTHTHSGPVLGGIDKLPDEQRERLAAYRHQLRQRLVEVVKKALSSRREARFAWGQGFVGFARNRRVLKDGTWTGFGAVHDAPADHRLRVLRVTDVNDQVMAVVIHYACHCTTLRGNFTQIHGDWAGCAQAYVEETFPQAVAMVNIGCGADLDPYPHGTVALAEIHGREVSREVARVLAGKLTPVESPLTTRREMLEIAHGESEGEALSYPITAWSFGEDLVMVFLTGEVVVDYALRFKREYEGKPLWLTAYAHKVPGYVISKRILKEGGYEARNSLSARITGGNPEKLDPPMEDRIVSAVRRLLPAKW